MDKQDLGNTYGNLQTLFMMKIPIITLITTVPVLRHTITGIISYFHSSITATSVILETLDQAGVVVLRIILMTLSEMKLGVMQKDNLLTPPWFFF